MNKIMSERANGVLVNCLEHKITPKVILALMTAKKKDDLGVTLDVMPARRIVTNTGSIN